MMVLQVRNSSGARAEANLSACCTGVASDAELRGKKIELEWAGGNLYLWVVMKGRISPVDALNPRWRAELRKKFKYREQGTEGTREQGTKGTREQGNEGTRERENKGLRD